MHAVFINHCHPDMPHICATRMLKFSQAFAAMGHRVVLLTEALGSHPNNVTPENLLAELDQHDWTRPYYLPIKPIPDETLSHLRDGKLDWLTRKAVIAWRYALENGLYQDWLKGAMPYLNVLPGAFQPDIIWASFGNTSVWSIAEHLSRRAGCPWVADIKDNWQNFIPFGLRKLVASRFKSAAYMTSFSERHLAEANQWFSQNKTAIYSGFDDEVIDADVPVVSDDFEILLTGSVYDVNNLLTFVSGLEHWLQKRTSTKAVRFVYAGNDHERVRASVQKLSSLCKININEFLDIKELLVAQRRAAINAYISFPGRFGFHHKAIELMAAQKPILCFPAEVDETMRIISHVGGVLYSCTSIEGISAGFEAAYGLKEGVKSNSKLSQFSWQGQARVLESILENVRHH